MSAPAPFLPSTLLEWLEASAKALLIVGTVVGAGWAFFEYRNKEEQRRVEGSLGYVKRFAEGSLLESTKRIGNAWYSSQAALQRLQDSATEEEYRQRHYQLAMTVVERVALPDGEGTTTYGIVADVDAVVAFFSELSICVRAKLCDGKAAHAHFDTYAQRFYCLHEPYLSWKAASYSSAFGKDLAEFGGRDPTACRKS